MAQPPAADDFDDELFESALDDFIALDLAAPSPSSNAAGVHAGDGLLERGAAAGVRPVQGLGMGLPDPKARRKLKQQPPREDYASAALEKMARETREALRELGSSSSGLPGADISGFGAGPGGFDEEGMVEEFLKQFEAIAGSQDMESIVDTMMQQLLSKDILQEPMKELVEKYPKWLDEHKSELKKEDYDRYQQQYELMVALSDVYDNEPENYSKIFNIMQKMQECGQPPDDIVRGIVPDVDLSNIGQMSSEMGSGPNCCVM